MPNSVSAATMKRTWHTVAHKYNGKAEQQEHLSAMIDALDWRALPLTKVPAMQSMGIKEAIRQLQIPSVSQVAYNGMVAGRYCVYGIEAAYTNGRARIYLMDRGSDLIPLASDFWGNEHEGQV